MAAFCFLYTVDPAYSGPGYSGNPLIVANLQCPEILLHKFLGYSGIFPAYSGRQWPEVEHLLSKP